MAFNFEQYGVSNPNLYGDTTAGRQHNIDLIFQNVLGRNADSGGRAYWDAQVAEKGDQAYQDLVNTAIAGAEYKDRASAVSANPNITEAELDSLSSAYVSPYHHGSGSAVANWQPGDDLTQEIANAVTTNTSNADGTTNASANYGDASNNTVADVISAFQEHNKNTLAAGGSDIKGTGNITGGVQQSGSNTITAEDVLAAYNQGAGSITGDGSDGSNTATGAGGLTMDDLNSWWSGIDKSSFGGGNGMQDFMQFMMMMNMMGGGMGRGMGGGSQYGYGGLNPGGVSQAFDYKDMASWMKDTFGSGSGGTTTGNLNLTGTT